MDGSPSPGVQYILVAFVPQHDGKQQQNYAVNWKARWMKGEVFVGHALMVRSRQRSSNEALQLTASRRSSAEFITVVTSGQCECDP